METLAVILIWVIGLPVAYLIIGLMAISNLGSVITKLTEIKKLLEEIKNG